MRKEVFIDGIKYISQSEVDAIRADEFAKGYYSAKEQVTDCLNLNSNDTGKEERLKVETRDKEFIQICFGNAISGACFDYNVDHLKEILTRDMAILQPTNDNAFWTDELVKEFVIAYNKIDKLISGVDPIGQTIKEWKQSKQSAPEPSAQVEPTPTQPVVEDKPAQINSNNDDVPCLSLNDLVDVWSGEVVNYGKAMDIKQSPMYKRFEQIAKQKLNK